MYNAMIGAGKFEKRVYRRSNMCLKLGQHDESLPLPFESRSPFRLTVT